MVEIVDGGHPVMAWLPIRCRWTSISMSVISDPTMYQSESSKSYLHKVDAKSHPSPLCPLWLAHSTHIISSTAPTYAPRFHHWICVQTQLEKHNCWLVYHKHEDRTPPTNGSMECVDNNNRVLVVAIVGQSRMSNHLFSDTALHLRDQNISRAPIQSICCTCNLLLGLWHCECIQGWGRWG